MGISIIFNGELLQLPVNVVTVEDFLNWRGIADKGTAVAVNGKIVKAASRSVTRLNPLDNIIAMSAAYGG